MILRSILVWALLVLLAPIAANATTVVVNSDDWMDVYSGMQYAHLSGYNAKFMTSKRYATVLTRIVSKSEDILVIESQRVPFTINLAGNLRIDDYEARTVFSSGGRATNIELAKRVNTTKYILIDPAYGYNSIAVIPYALYTGAYVLFADRKNTDQVLDFLNTRQVDSLLLYGQLDDLLYERLAVYSPEVINKGNRYKDNIEIIRKYLVLNPRPQLLLTDGSIIEEELMKAGSNNEVTLLIGKGNPPEETVEFVGSVRFPTAVLIGNHLSQSGKVLKDRTGMPVFMKFAQGIASGTSSEQVKALDMFPLPTVDLNLGLRRTQYNTITKSVEITYENKGIRAHIRTSAGILAGNERVITVGDVDTQRIEANETRSFSYEADLTEYVAAGQNLTIDMFTLYGESPTILDHAIAFTGPLQVVTIQDRCDMAVKSLEYNTRTQRFRIKVDNDGPVLCFVDAELRSIIVEDVPITIEYPGTMPVGRRDSKVMEIKQRMTPVDLADNPDVLVHLMYGEQEDLLINTIDVRLPIKEYTPTGLSMTTILIGIISLLIIIIIIMFVMMRKKKKADKGKKKEEKEEAEEEKEEQEEKEEAEAEKEEQEKKKAEKGKEKPKKEEKVKKKAEKGKKKR